MRTSAAVLTMLTTVALTAAGPAALGRNAAHAATTCTTQTVPTGILVTCTGDPATLQTSAACQRPGGHRYGITRTWPVPGQGLIHCGHGDLMTGHSWRIL